MIAPPESPKTLTPTDRVNLVLSRIEILKLKADHYNWHCYVPDEVKEQLEDTLLMIGSELGIERV